MKAAPLFIIVFFATAVALSAQRDDCATDAYTRARLAAAPGLQAQRTSILERILTWIRNHPYDPHLHQIPVTIPVVVHVLKRNASEDVSDDVIRAQIQLTNTHLRNATASLSTVPQPFRDLSANARIQLQLALRDPDGRATTGIKRYTVTKAIYQSDATDDAKQASAGGADPWDTNRYLNIWVCNLSGACGYATFPFLYGTATPVARDRQGIVVDRGCFGPTAFKNGTTLVHELGHFLGVKHISGDASCGNDDVDDTPQQAAQNSGCPTYPKASTCSGSAPNGELFYNFMDYTTCRNLFTKGQVQMFWAYLNYYTTQANALGRTATTARGHLLNSNALLPVGGTERSYLVDFVPEYNNLPSWKAALAMVHSYAVQQCITVDEINRLTTAGRTARSGRYRTLPADLADAIFGLGLRAEEVLMCYTPSGFYNNVINRGPVALIEVDAATTYGMVISGMRISGDRAVALVEDPMNIGPRLNVTLRQDGHEKLVDYGDLSAALDNAVIAGKQVYMVRLGF